MKYFAKLFRQSLKPSGAWIVTLVIAMIVGSTANASLLRGRITEETKSEECEHHRIQLMKPLKANLNAPTSFRKLRGPSASPQSDLRITRAKQCASLLTCTAKNALIASIAMGAYPEKNIVLPLLT